MLPYRGNFELDVPAITTGRAGVRVEPTNVSIVTGWRMDRCETVTRGLHVLNNIYRALENRGMRVLWSDVSMISPSIYSLLGADSLLRTGVLA